MTPWHPRKAEVAVDEAGAIDLDGPEIQLLSEAAARTGLFLVIGCIERDGATLYCTMVYIDGAIGVAG